ncbi:MAG: ATP-binding cassette domain-containing protein, partial [Pseudomonadota bacterium]
MTITPAIAMRGVNKFYEAYHALKDINLRVAKGEKIVICGPSGSGKSTMIRTINQLEEHQSGSIEIDGEEINADAPNIEMMRRRVGMVFQHFNLFPNMTILQNCTLAPVRTKLATQSEAEDLAMVYLEKVQIADQAHKSPGQLSGGQ